MTQMPSVKVLGIMYLTKPYGLDEAPMKRTLCRGPALGVSPVGLCGWGLYPRGPALLQNLFSHQNLPNSPAFNEASCVHQVSHFPLDAVKTVQGCPSTCETDPTPTS